MKPLLCIFSLSALILATGCQPDEMVVELYTSDIQKALTNGVVDVPVTTTFKVMGEDKERHLPKTIDVAKRYLNDTAEYNISKGLLGKVLLVKCTIPMGTEAALKPFLETHHCPFAITVTESNVVLAATDHIKIMNQDLNGINYMLDVDLPARSTQVRFLGDMEKAPEITAIAVFVDNQPELIFQEAIERRKNVTIEFKGGDDSIYSGLPPQFKILF